MAVTAHNQVVEAFNGKIEAVVKDEVTIHKLHQAAKTQQKGFKKGEITNEQQLSKDIQTRLHMQMASMQELYEESKLWQEVKENYEMQANSANSKIKQIKTSIQEMKAKVEMNMDRIKVLIDTNMERFTRHVAEAMDRGWAEWSRQAARRPRKSSEGGAEILQTGRREHHDYLGGPHK